MKNFSMVKISRVWLNALAITFILTAAGWWFSRDVYGQLNDCSLIDEYGNIDASAIGGCIGKSLRDQVGSGHGDAHTPGSAVYLIKRDPARSIRRGRQLFQRKFTQEEGQGPRHNAASSGDITTTRRLAAGFGGDVATRPDSRDAPHLFGLGLVEMLADEMTQELRQIRDDALAQVTRGRVRSAAVATDEQTHFIYLPLIEADSILQDAEAASLASEDEDGVEAARQRPRRIRRRLISKGVDFGTITVFENGRVNTSDVRGVDDDLRVRPFFHEGSSVSMREFIIGAFKDEMGLEAWDPILCAVTDPDNPVAMTSPAGFHYDPALDSYERPPICDRNDDGDNDGVTQEIDPALIDHMEFYLLNYFKPGQYETTSRTRQGQQLMSDIGCTSCHVQDLTIENDRRVADVETVYDPVNGGVFNQLYATAEAKFEAVNDGHEYPYLLPQSETFTVRNFYSDLKRHDLGPLFHERDWDGTMVTEFVTEPLWGVGSTSPYGHDGRSINLDQVIRRHGGEAAEVKDAYAQLSANDRRKVIEFLETLILFPPDDTASNLNPGQEGHPQDPANHGTINLGALFQIGYEGGE